MRYLFGEEGAEEYARLRLLLNLAKSGTFWLSFDIICRHLQSGHKKNGQNRYSRFEDAEFSVCIV